MDLKYSSSYRGRFGPRELVRVIEVDFQPREGKISSSWQGVRANGVQVS